MPSSSKSNRYQEGSLERVSRGRGKPDVWKFRWRETAPDGSRVQRKLTIGDTRQYPDRSSAKRAAENLRAEINAADRNVGRMTVTDLWGHFEQEELRSTAVDRSPTTIDCYLNNMKNHILPRWGSLYIDEVKATGVEKWLGELPLARPTKAKLRNQLSALFSHAIRHELYDRLNPISSVRQSAKREKTPDTLTVSEMQGIIASLPDLMRKLAVLFAAVTALRRSEIRGLRWSDIDFGKSWINLKVGVVQRHLTKLKTEASAKGVPIPQELVDLLAEWREVCAYPEDSDWVFASPTKAGKSPIWLDTVMSNYVKPAARKLGISKRIGWHTFRHSFATYLGQRGENVKVVQELMRHSNPSVTMTLYQQADVDAKRTAQGRFNELFA